MAPYLLLSWVAVMKGAVFIHTMVSRMKGADIGVQEDSHPILWSEIVLQQVILGFADAHPDRDPQLRIAASGPYAGKVRPCLHPTQVDGIA